MHMVNISILFSRPLPQSTLNVLQNLRRIGFQFAFPNYDDSPTGFHQSFLIPTIPFDVLLEFLRPEIRTCLGGRCRGTPFVPVPKATMNKYYSPEFFENDVRAAGEFSIVQPKAVTRSMEHRS